MCYEANAVMLRIAQGLGGSGALCARCGARSSRVFVARVRRAWLSRVVVARGRRAWSSRVVVARGRRAWSSRVVVAQARCCGEAEAVCVCVCVGKCSEAYYLERNSAMDDSIGGS